ncbi:hypothetical protein HMPREF9440_00516, partial [Sutterella parvirubra YIT 11816]
MGHGHDSGNVEESGRGRAPAGRSVVRGFSSRRQRRRGAPCA